MILESIDLPIPAGCDSVSTNAERRKCLALSFKELEKHDDGKMGKFKSFYSGRTRGASHYYRPNSEGTEYRRELKRLWNLYANHDDFENIRLFHEIGYQGSRSSGVYQPLMNFIQRYPAGARQKNEHSCWSYRSPDDLPAGNFYVEVKGRVTFASTTDAHTEELRKAYLKDGEQNPDPFPSYAYVWSDSSSGTKGNLVGFSDLPYPDEFLGAREIDDEFFEESMSSDVILFWKDMEVDLSPVEWENPELWSDLLDASRKKNKYRQWSQEIKDQRKDQLKDLAATGKIKAVPLPEFYANSGLPKRPALSTPIEYFALSKDDFLKQNRQLVDVVVDNWSWDTIFINTGDNQAVPDFPDELLELCQQNNIKLIVQGEQYEIN